MAVYVVYERIETLETDPVKSQTYSEGVGPTLAQYGGKVLAGGGSVEVVEGEWHPRSLLIMEFEDMERFRAWYNSPEYAPLKELRHQLSRGNGVVVEGRAL